MKKIFIALTLILALSFTSNAQEMKALKAETKEIIKPENAAKSDASEISKFLSLDDTMTDNFYRLFLMKHQTLQNELTPERKVELARVIEAKIRATLGDEMMAKLEKNKELLKKLVN
ncbi:hypothetical protein [Flavobacterium capsici]|uniref:Uncharacterized protein n=1 Tax=Flavobacterium capsici TaxID=3075618 RepID=A0AA96F0F6_9FLAO|nr:MULTISPECIES: hypothetical protein [unclassified Flavobacterium]WNM19076.1 hypothetical protein RN608_13835 [Flavobacterium sp. PMR2A8]WNM20465.1 hypothetical protein RN605_07135 [Flavobacterium sp. PMTSA4]